MQLPLSPPRSLPIDLLLPELVRLLGNDRPSENRTRNLVIEAPPGAGKTTRVPRKLLELCAGEVWVLEPRRLAARLAAKRVAEELGEALGGTVGYQVRFESVASSSTRLLFLTEGLLTRKLLKNPELKGVAAVVLDEFHERHLATDLSLALLRRLQLTARPDLVLIAMSATLDAAPLAQYLGCGLLRSQGRTFPVEVVHASQPSERRLEEQVAAAVIRALRLHPTGDLLVFLPGVAEIVRAREACTAAFHAPGVEIDAEMVALHGELAPEDQQHAITPGRRRKVILSTNVAESSITVEGVVAVIDSGLVRSAAHNPWSGLSELVVQKISRASAIQRAGRAGRLGPGTAYRLYTQPEFSRRPAYDEPEIRRADLTELTLTTAAIAGAAPLPWFEAPRAEAEAAARALLKDLGALDREGSVTKMGQNLLTFPLHPRLGRLLWEATSQGLPYEGALLAALLSEREVLLRDALLHVDTGPSDLLDRAERIATARSEGGAGAFSRQGLDLGRAQAVLRTADQLGRLVSTAYSTASTTERHDPRLNAQAFRLQEAKLLRATLSAFPDRVGRRREPGKAEVVLEVGGSADLDSRSAVRDAQLLVGLDIEQRRGDDRGERRNASAGQSRGPRIRWASAVSQELLFDLFPDQLRYQNAVRWNAEAERVESDEELYYRGLLLESSPQQHPNQEPVAELLFAEARRRGFRHFVDPDLIDAWRGRFRFVHRLAPEQVPELTDEHFINVLEQSCAACRSFAELRKADVAGLVWAQISRSAVAQVTRLAPERLTLHGGRQVPVRYPIDGQPPFIESRLQDFLGMLKGPAVGGGRVPLVLHLLAPNGRALQVTQDLENFWKTHYPELRRQLARRYPRHCWPENPVIDAVRKT